VSTDARAVEVLTGLGRILRPYNERAELLPRLVGVMDNQRSGGHQPIS
jgi:hypothetical protein